ncbi:MAG: ABC transporter permease subunit [Verrucomicrobia bacterium]|nr:ABC transporter permease subunit [Verrucomicrobiota bacterium]
MQYRLNPLTERKLSRFRSIRRGYWSFLLVLGLTVWSLFAEFFVNDRALLVRYDGEFRLPLFGVVELGNDYALGGVKENIPVNYRALKEQFAGEAGNWVIMPIIPYSPNENIPYEGVLKPRPPSIASQNYLGTDSTGRDILARLIYSFRIAIFFSLAFMALTFLIGITIGCIMGYFGGAVDLTVQRLIEIWSNVPFLYMVIIVFSVIPSTFSISTRIFILLLIMVLFSWTSITYYMRTATFKEKARDYSSAALVLGAGTGRMIFKHILPNTISTIVTFIPFVLVQAITAITALDFLGYGLPPPTPSMGELLKQGRDTLNIAPWIVFSAFGALVLLLTLVTFVGEAVREAFDPKKFTLYS